MGTDERDRLFGSTYRERAGLHRELACLERKRDAMAKAITTAVDLLFREICQSSEAMPDLPDREVRCSLVRQIRFARERIETLTVTLKDMGAAE